MVADQNSSHRLGRKIRRPAFHFTPPSGWMNDPNGLVYLDGEYHLFYQHNPNSVNFGEMHWGHAVSTDLVSWSHLPVALAPDEMGLIYSGCAFVDVNNTSGLGATDTHPLVAAYTYHDQKREVEQHTDIEAQAIAFSQDRGRTWIKFPGNPVLKNHKKQRDFRDPKIFWHELTQQWIMVLAVYDHVEFFKSSNLTEWWYGGAFGQGVGVAGGLWECPDLFPLRIDNSEDFKWVLIVSINPGGPQEGSGTQYFVGDFDGASFLLDPEFEALSSLNGAEWLDWGSDNYAGVTWSDVPQSDGRRLFIGWMSNWRYAQDIPCSNWRGMMTVPRELSLLRENGQLRLRSLPVREIMANMRLVQSNDGAQITQFPYAHGHITLIAKLSTGSLVGEFGIVLTNAHGDAVRIGFDVSQNCFFIQEISHLKSAERGSKPPGRHTMPRIMERSDIKLEMLVDENSVELFADNGVSVMTETIYPSSPFSVITVFHAGHCVAIDSFSVESFEYDHSHRSNDGG